MKNRLKAGIHMTADDRRSQKVSLRSFVIKWKHASAIVCDPAIADRRRSQIAKRSAIVYDRLGSIAIVQAHGNQRSKRIP